MNSFVSIFCCLASICTYSFASAGPIKECHDNPKDCELGLLQCKFVSMGIYQNEIALEEKFGPDDDAVPFVKNNVRWLMDEAKQEYLDVHVTGRPLTESSFGAAAYVTHWVRTGADSARILHQQGQGFHAGFDSPVKSVFALMIEPFEKQFTVETVCVFLRNREF
jgi:hypothetical protein